MTSRILVYTHSAICLISDIEKEWAKRSLSICKTADFEEVIQEIRYHNYLLIVISVTNETIEQAQNQIKILRSITNAPIAVIADEPVDTQIKIAALTNGADQFIISPLSPEEAAVSGMALIRRFTELSKSVCPVTIYYDHGILISIDYRKVFIGGKEIELFKKEFDILSLLVRNHAKVLTYEQIFYEVWGDDYIDNSKDLLWSQISRLREKLQIDKKLPRYLKTVRGIGYSFDPQYAWF